MPSKKKDGPEAKHSTPTVVLTGRFAPAPPPRPPLNASEAAQVLRDTGIAELIGLKSILDKVPYVKLSPQVPFVDGKGWLNFLAAWFAIQPGDPTNSPEGSATWAQNLHLPADVLPFGRPPALGYLEIHVAGLPPDAMCLVTVDGATPLHAAMDPVAGFKVTAFPGEQVFVNVERVYQTLMIPIESFRGSAAIQIEPVGVGQWHFYRATVLLI